MGGFRYAGMHALPAESGGQSAARGWRRGKGTALLRLFSAIGSEFGAEVRMDSLLRRQGWA